MVRDALVLDASASASPAKNTSACGKKKEEKKGDEKKSAPAAKKAPVTAARTTRGVKGKR